MLQTPVVRPLRWYTLSALTREFIEFLSAQQQNEKTSCGYLGCERIVTDLAELEHNWPRYVRVAVADGQVLLSGVFYAAVRAVGWGVGVGGWIVVAWRCRAGNGVPRIDIPRVVRAGSRRSGG